jgi:beta-N-acetylhexosaminidase
MLLAGARGTEADGELARLVRDMHVGGILLFDRDLPGGGGLRNIVSPAQLARLTRDLRALADGPLLVAADQEGGAVARLSPANGFPAFPSPAASAAAGPDAVRAAARGTAEMLSRSGVNVDLAPCVDLHFAGSSIIGSRGRAFSSDPARVAEAAGIWLEELAARGIAGCLKHFPGHGSAAGDTHEGFVEVTATWSEAELVPYRRLFAEKTVPLVMAAHVFHAGLDPDVPASLSRKILTDLLRGKLGFQGAIVTDDLSMGAIAKHFPLREALRRAVLAGADWLCLGNNLTFYDPELVPRAAETLCSLVRDGELPRERLAESAEKIRALARALPMFGKIP